MKAMRVAEARARFGELLDQAEQGNEVLIERKGVRFRLIAESTEGTPVRVPVFDFVDPAVMHGQWTWKIGASGTAFMPRRKRR